jgi:hypothetical protein
MTVGGSRGIEGLHMMPPLLKKPVFAGFSFFKLAWGLEHKKKPPPKLAEA